MGRLIVVCLVAACGSEHAALVDAPPEGPALPLDLDIDVRAAASGIIEVYTRGTDRPCGCAKQETDWTFPEVGACIGYNDVGECWPCESCLRAELVGSGVQQQAVPDILDIQFNGLPLPLPADLVLRLSGCGHPTFEIPLAPFDPPVPALELELSAPDVTARWTTAVPSTSAVIGYSAGLGASVCHVDSTEHTFTGVLGPFTSPLAKIYLTTYLPPLVVPTPAGDVRIWRGASTSSSLQTDSVY